MPSYAATDMSFTEGRSCNGAENKLSISRRSHCEQSGRYLGLTMNFLLK